MNTHGFVAEDDLILYSMQALSPAEMRQVAAQVESHPELAQRLTEIQSVLGLYASGTTTFEEVPAGALERLHSSIAREVEQQAAPAAVARPVAAPVSLPVRTQPRPERKASLASHWGLLWSGWALAAMLLLGFLLQFQQNRQNRQTVATTTASLQDAQGRAAALASERDRLQNSLQERNGQVQASQEQVQASREEAANAKDRAADLSARVAGSNQRAEREAARADQLAATARETAAERSQLSSALAREQQTASRAAESQQVLAALADPAALHVTLTVPKQKKRPSGRGTYLASSGTLVFTGSDLGPLPAGKVYQLWLMPADGSAPIPAGTFVPDTSGNATLISSRFQRQIAAKGFAITVEAAGGSQKPTLPILLAGTA